MLHNIKGSNINHLGAALVTTCGTICAEDVFQQVCAHCMFHLLMM